MGDPLFPKNQRRRAPCSFQFPRGVSARFEGSTFPAMVKRICGAPWPGNVRHNAYHAKTQVAAYAARLPRPVPWLILSCMTLRADSFDHDLAILGGGSGGYAAART